jgi:hypothetical protein
MDRTNLLLGRLVAGVHPMQQQRGLPGTPIRDRAAAKQQMTEQEGAGNTSMERFRIEKGKREG